MVGPRKTGYSLIEIAFALAILVTVLLTAMSFIGTSMTLQRTSVEVELAQSALERRAAVFRALLHSGPLDTPANRALQFQTVLDTLTEAGVGAATLTTLGTTDTLAAGGDLAPAPKTYDFDLVAGAPKLPSGTNQAQLRVWAFTKDFEAETVCGLTALDLDGDSTTFFPAAAGDTPNLVEDLHILPLKLEIEWVDATADASRPTRTLTLITILY